MTLRKSTTGLMTSLLLLLNSLSGADLITFDMNESIPDNDATGLQDTQNLSGYDTTLESITVVLRIFADAPDFAYGGDFYASLQSESGAYCVLLNRVGRTASNAQGYNMNGFDVTFSIGADDIHLAENSSPSYDGAGRLTGTWGADGRNVDPDSVLNSDARTATLDVFDGINPNGDWTLFVADMGQNGTATLDSWGLDIAAVPEPATMSLLGLSGFSLLLWNRRKTRG